jgi:dipeptidyl aminopeptidase/acylaminoacyl peptidase
MRTVSVFLFAFAVIALSGCEKVDEVGVKRYTVDQFMNTTTVFGSSFSHDESSILFSSDRSGIFNAWIVPVDGGQAVQVTHSDSNAVFADSFFPEDNRILYQSDQAGNEIYHIYLLEEDGSVRDLTPYENARAAVETWSHDRTKFYFSSNKRDQRFMDIYEMDIKTFEPEMVYQNDAAYDFHDISDDDRFMSFSETVTEHNSEMYLYDRENGELKHLSPHEGDINYSPQSFSTDSKSLYYLTDEGSEFTYLKRYDIESGVMEQVEKAEWDIMYAYFSYDGKYRIMGINNNAVTEIRVLDTHSGEQLSLPKLPDADITSVGISRSESLMTFYVNGSRSPRNLYVYDFESKSHRKLTESLNPDIDPEDLVDAEIVSYPSFDGLEIPALLYKPHQVQPGDDAPALVSVHGGPGGQARVGYSGARQYLVNHGYVVIDVNNRGSSGYGKTFYKLDDMKHGEDDLADCVAAKAFLASTGYVDTSKVGIMGGSYGGYMVLAALTFQPDEFAVGVDMFGISNWVRTLNSIPPWWESFREALYVEMGNPVTDEEYVRSISPLFHAENIRRPFIVLQGANDPRVLKAESDEIVDEARKNGVPVEYVLFEDEGHGFLKKENRIEGNKAILKFLDTYLKGETAL